MSYLFLWLSVACNCVVLFFISGLAVDGSGNAKVNGVLLARIWGYLWIAACTVFALIRFRRGDRASAIAVAVLTLPAGYAAMVAWLMGTSALDRLKPNSPEFEAACKVAGPSYIQQPATKVESIAYDWEQDTHPPDTNYFEMDGRNNVTQLGGGFPRFPPTIKFVERRCCEFEGRPTNRIGPFVHHPATGEYFGTTELTADALVSYKVSHTEIANSAAGFKTVELTVTDRRDGARLATLRYLLDERGRRGCGAVSDGVMDEQAFVRRAIGVD